MILTGPEIFRQRLLGALTIEPFDTRQLNPVSYNYRLSRTLRTHRATVIDTRAEHELEEFAIPDDGVVLQPGRVYLGTTVEAIGSTRFVPSLIGRSSLGRLGMFLQYSADLGNLGACHRWTLEIKVVQPLRVYAEMVTGQVSFWTVTGARRPYAGYFGHIDEAAVPPAGLLTAPTARSPFPLPHRARRLP
ncbi:deoxycytidine deaminase [Streptomyces sp. AV19]|uniref:dCTP deaminase n=1 Tax=Streptomyces sp. AV19 TaxID=2793068 RepID=UPI0018FE95F0|nr:deoxycytidine deaminase [Streptomyces sp. AV19]MBH1933284.1 deoxycytidine deaminase [Streptomyces sp. AV19]MDG4536175.1 deoxycytidine deaminase [Streptomyces sp. AV19]